MRPSAPTTVIDFDGCSMGVAAETKECSIRMIGSDHMGEVIVRFLVAEGVLSDSSKFMHGGHRGASGPMPCHCASGGGARAEVWRHACDA